MRWKELRMKLLFYCILGIVLAVLVGCTWQVKDQFERYLQEKGIKNCKLVKINSYHHISFSELKQNITIEEVNERIKRIVESSEERFEVTKPYIISAGDAVSASFIAYEKGNVVFSGKDEEFVVGNSVFFPELEEVIIGHTVGEAFSEQIIVNIDGSECELSVNVVINKVFRFVTHTEDDPYVWQLCGVDNKEDFVQWCTEQVRVEKTYLHRVELENNIFDELIDLAIFEIDVEEVAEYSLKFVEATQKIANIYGKSFEDYLVDILKTNEETFYQSCYEKGERQIKEMLVVKELTDMKYSKPHDIDDEEYEMFRQKIVEKFLVLD